MSQQTPKMDQDCNKCKSNGFAGQKIGFIKQGEDPATGKIKWQLIEPDPSSPTGYKEHQHKGAQKSGGGYGSKNRHAIDISIVTDVVEARKLLALGWDFYNAFPATVANIPHMIMVKYQ